MNLQLITYTLCLEWEESGEDRKYGRKIWEESNFLLFGIGGKIKGGRKVKFIFPPILSPQNGEKVEENGWKMYYND